MLAHAPDVRGSYGLDDAIVFALIVRSVLRAGGPDLLREHWPGPQASLNALTRLAYGRAA